MAAPYTPGPWVAEHRDNGAVVIRSPDDQNRPVAEIWHNGHDPKANGALVAAAPELLAVLSEYLILGRGKCTISRALADRALAIVKLADGQE